MHTIARIRSASRTLLHGPRAAAGSAWQRLPRVERVAAVVATAAAAGLLLALVQTCEESVQRGERIRAEQRQAAGVR